MDINENNEITIYDDTGKEYLMKILFTYESEDRNAEYVFVYSDDNPDDVFLFKYNENHELFEVEDEEELSEAQEVLNLYNDGGME